MEKDTKKSKPKQRIVRKGGRDYLSFERYECPDLQEKLLSKHEEEQDLFNRLEEAERKNLQDLMEELANRLNEVRAQDNKIERDLQERYIDSFKDNPSEILDVIRGLVDSISHDAFLRSLQGSRDLLDSIREKDPTFIDTELLEERSVANYTNYMRYVSVMLKHEIAVAIHYNLMEYQEILEEYVSQYYSAFIMDFHLFESPEDLQSITTNPVDYFRIPKDKAITALWSGKYRPGQNQITLFDLDLPDGEKQKIFADVSITSLKDLPGVKGIENLSADEELIYNSIYSHYRAGNVVLTDSMIYKTLMGNRKIVTSEKQAQEIENFINMASVTQITINDRDRARLRGERDYTAITTNLLSVTKVEKVEINGTVVASAWVIDKEPVLGWWAEHTGEISSVPIRVLDTGTSSNYNWLRSYLIQQISWIKNGKGKRKRSNKILFDTIYKQNDITDRRYKDRCRKQTFKMLDAWVDMGWITSYRLVYDAHDSKKKTPVAVSIKYSQTEQIEAS